MMLDIYMRQRMLSTKAVQDVGKRRERLDASKRLCQWLQQFSASVD